MFYVYAKKHTTQEFRKITIFCVLYFWKFKLKIIVYEYWSLLTCHNQVCIYTMWYPRQQIFFVSQNLNRLDLEGYVVTKAKGRKTHYRIFIPGKLFPGKKKNHACIVVRG